MTYINSPWTPPANSAGPRQTVTGVYTGGLTSASGSMAPRQFTGGEWNSHDVTAQIDEHDQERVAEAVAHLRSVLSLRSMSEASKRAAVRGACRRLADCYNVEFALAAKTTGAYPSHTRRAAHYYDVMHIALFSHY